MPVELLGMVAERALDTGLGLALQGHNDRRQLRQQQKLGEQQLGLNMQMLDYQTRKELQMWKDTNYSAQVEELEKAGLNPAYLYAKTGAGGATIGGSAPNVSAPNAPSGGGEILGMQMLNAQRDLIKAQTEKTLAEKEKIAGVDTQLGETQIQSLTQGIQNQRAVEALTRVQTGIAEVEADLKTDSYEDVLNTIHYTARQAEKQLQALTINNEISEATKDEKIKIIEGELIGLGLANELKKLQIPLTEEQTKKVVADVAQGWKSLDIQQQNAITNMVNSDTAKYNAQTNVREFLERARNNQFGNEMAREALQLEKFLKDVPESTKVTLGAIGGLLAIFKKRR